MKTTSSNIGIVANAAWNIHNFRLDLIQLLKNEGFQVTIFAPYDKKYNFEEKGIHFVSLNNLTRKGTNPVKDLLLIHELFNKFKRHEIDIILLFTPKPNIYGSFAASFLSIPSIATVTGLGYTFISRSFAGFMIRKLYKVALKRSSLVFFHNRDDRSLFLKKNWVNKNQSKVISGSGVDTQRFHPVKPENNSTISLLFIGRLLVDKGILELLEAFHRVSKTNHHIRLNILGMIDPENPSSLKMKELKTWLSKNNNIIHINGSDDVRPYIAASNIVVLPSYREGLPRTIMEAMSMEKPVIVSDVPGCRDCIIKDKETNGLMCKPKDVDSLAERISEMISYSPEKLHQMGIKGRKYALSTFDSKIVTKNYLKEINKLLNQ